MNPALYVPGALTPVTINSPSGTAYEVISGGAGAGGLWLSGAVALEGQYTFGGLVLDGIDIVHLYVNVASSTGLSVGAGSTVSAITVRDVDGSIAVAGIGAALTASAAVTIGGLTSGFHYEYRTSGNLTVSAGATLTAGAIDVTSGAFAVSGTGSKATLGDALTLGAPGVPPAPVLSYVATTGSLSVDAGATLTTQGAVSLLYGSSASVTGSGSRLTSAGQLTISNAGASASAAAPYFTVRNGGFVQATGLAVQFMPSDSALFATLTVDATSTLEVGLAGNAAVGAITVDVGSTAAIAGALSINGAVVDNGVIAETGGALTVDGNVSGSGQLQVGKNSTLILNGSVAATATIAFLDAGAALSIGSSGSAAYAVNATLTGFQTGDSLALATPVSTATYVAGSGGSPGTLILSNGAVTVETLHLTGDFTGQSFFVTPSVANGAPISLIKATETAGATGSPTADGYLWIGSSGGSWSTAGNWDDTTTAINPAPYVPGTLTPVTITGPTDATVEAITDGGSAASIGLTGNVSLGGGYAVGGALNIGSPAVTPTQSGAVATLTPGSLALAADGTIAAGSIDVLDGTLSLGAGTSVFSAGPVAVGLAIDGVVPYNGGVVTTGGASGTLDLAAGATLTTLGGVLINSGTLNAVRATVYVGDALTVGTGFESGTVNLSAGAKLSTLGAASIDAGALNNAGGAFSVGGALTLEEGATASQVSVTSGGTVTVGGAITDASNLIAVSGFGSKLITSGTLTVAGGGSTSYTSPVTSHYHFGSIAAQSGGFAQFGGVSFSAASFGTTDLFPGMSVDSMSTIEIGAAGSAAAGAITIDAGRAVTVNSTAYLSGALVDNGTVAVNSGTLVQTGDLSGSGTVAIGKNATLDLYGASGAANTIAFLGTGAALSIGTHDFHYVGTTYVANPYSVGATLTGFQIGDSLVLATPVSAAAYVAGSGGSPGALTLSNGGTTVETLHLAGNFTGTSFSVGPTVNNSTTISLVGQAPAKPATDPLFDSSYYLAHYPDVAAAGVDPYRHYLAFGWKEGRDPSALFSTSYYLAHNPDVAAAHLNPLLHFEAYGYKEGRDPSASFSLSDYRAANPDVKAAGLDPLLHYVTYGHAEGRAAFAVAGPANRLVDAAYYYAVNPDVKAAGLDASAHYLTNGWREGRNPDALFDTNYYLTQNPDVRAAGVDPMLHFESFGYKEGRDPSLLFSDSKYLAANPDVKAAGLNPLLHYLGNGQAEGRAAFLTGGTAPADPLVNAAFYDKQLGATLVPAGVAAPQQAASGYDASGWHDGLNPDPFFDTKYYLSHNRDVAAARLDPLTHYEQYGWHEGRDPSAQFSTHRYLAAYADVKNAGIDPLLHYVANGQAEGRTAFAA